MTQDKIYSLPRHRVGQFSFDESVVDVFPDMISRSVPGYASILSMIEQLTARFATPASNLFDLGCSLGAATRLMRQQAPKDCLVYAVDSAPAMIKRLGELINQEDEDQAEGCEVQLVEADVCEVEIRHASFVVLNLTLQFVPLADRPGLLGKICEGLLPGGALLLSEKICFDDRHQQQLLTELHHDFKRAHGYSDLEIAQKRTAIENFLIPETMQAHCDRLRSVGFEQVVPWFQCFNFASILAVKSS
jgi:tRNA (cmo5U34)-methyltransferase